jgi:hypothetical protein
MPRVGFEPMAPVFERAKTVHTFHRAATVIGSHVPVHYNLYLINLMRNQNHRPIHVTVSSVLKHLRYGIQAGASFI